MNQEEKDLLLKDLSARLPYGVIVQYKGHNTIIKNKLLTGSDLDCNMEYYKPYLRPMSSMTEEEWKEYRDITCCLIEECESWNEVDWLNDHHFDYRTIYDEDKKKYMSMIEKGLAIEVNEDNNPYKEK